MAHIADLTATIATQGTLALRPERRLVHYGTKPLTGVRSEKQRAPSTCHEKPIGLWVSALGRDDWKSWCRSEKFGLKSLACATEVRLRDDAAILRLRGSSDLDRFTDEYGELETWGAYRPRPAINWLRVSSEYGGIVISPYVWERRLHDRTSWYYGWDCASGCIWDASTVAELAPLSGGGAKQSPSTDGAATHSEPKTTVAQ